VAHSKGASGAQTQGRSHAVGAGCIPTGVAYSNLTVGQTYAMALAESGSFTEAAKLQQETIIGYERSGMPADKSFLAQNLAAYLQQQPCRQGCSTEDPVFRPRSPAATRAPG
jgi:hypothetical protein